MSLHLSVTFLQTVKSGVVAKCGSRVNKTFAFGYLASALLCEDQVRYPVTISWNFHFFGLILLTFLISEVFREW